MNCSYTPLKAEALLHLSGPDSLTFLQGQTTCDSSTVSAESAVLGAYCTPQGRVVCDFLLCQLAEDHFAMRLRSDILGTSCATFSKYIIFSKATLDATRSDWQAFALWGSEAAAAAEMVFGAIPTQRFGTVSGEHYSLVQMDTLGQQFECYLNAHNAEKLSAQLQDKAQVGTENEWQALQIQAGMGRITAGTTGELVPQSLNYDLTGHINFEKGCYTGQEVVARLHYRGTPKRRTHPAHVKSGANIASGTPIFTSEGTQSVGNIINGASEATQNIVLMSATDKGVDAGLYLGSPEGPALQIIDLPYSLQRE